MKFELSGVLYILKFFSNLNVSAIEIPLAVNKGIEGFIFLASFTTFGKTSQIILS